VKPVWLSDAKAVIGMVHAPALPGSPRHDDRADEAGRQLIERVLADAEALVQGGVHALMLENFGDVPFYPQRVPASTVAWMTRLACEIRTRYRVPLGINVLRNDGCSALAVAHAAGADFIRVNVLCGARIADQGILQGIAHDLLRERARLGAEHIAICADIDVKHSSPLGQQDVMQELADVIGRGLADAVIVSGSGTGIPLDREQLGRVRQHAGDVPVLAGSGVTLENVAGLVPDADGFIVGSWFKQEGQVERPVDEDRVRKFMAVLSGPGRRSQT
jgi:membrane complex biogenesis BtpA family protein